MTTIYRKNNSKLTFKTTSNNILIAKNDNDKLQHYLLPIGLNYKKFDRLEIENGSTFLKNSEISESYNSVVNLSAYPVRKCYPEENIEYSVVYDNSEYFQCTKLIYERHYVKNTPVGMVFTAKINDEIASLVVVHRLTYSNPNGRSAYLSDKQEIYEDKEQRDYAKKHMAWISRIVTVEKYEGQGIARRLCEQLPSLLKEIYPNGELNEIEVMTTWSIQDFKKYDIANDEDSVTDIQFDQENDLLCKAGFDRIAVKIKTDTGNISNKTRNDDGWNETQNIQYQNEDGDFIERSEKVARYYYVKKI
ncbi:GNAT family N-acetyltransferase [Fodinibius saliphilus]|uniref:GNAT family N-acetyltransferase n=1 Tax=Fodinibius saliphilus TaxID=1920650 RepID=UPI00110A0680|nr:GNAT family N-acetyltransferase [Fodinibius saliphilus]